MPGHRPKGPLAGFFTIQASLAGGDRLYHPGVPVVSPERADLSRVSVVGTSGSGKSTLAKQLAALQQVPHIDMDVLRWLPGWRERNDDEVRALLREATEQERWCACGNYTHLRKPIDDRVTCVIWLDYSFPRTFWRAIKRTVRRSVTRESVCNGNHETLRKALFTRDSILLWVITSYRRVRRRYTAKLIEADPPFDVIVFGHPREADALVNLLRSSASSAN